MKRLLWWIVLLANCTFVAGCLNSVPLEVRVNQSYSGGSIMLQQGQELVVELDTVAPLSWQVVSGGRKVFSEPVKKSVQTQRSTLESYVFTALFVGEDQLRIEEMQNGSVTPGQSNRVFTLHVVVTK